MYGVATQISYELNTIVAARVLDFGGGQTNVNKDTSFGGVAHPHYFVDRPQSSGVHDETQAKTYLWAGHLLGPAVGGRLALSRS